MANRERHAVIRDNSGIRNNSNDVVTDDLTGGCGQRNIDASHESERPKDLQGCHVKPARCASKTLDAIAPRSSSNAAKRASKSLTGNPERYAKFSGINAVNRVSNFGSSFNHNDSSQSYINSELDDEIQEELFIRISAKFYSHLQKMAQIIVQDYTVELKCVSDNSDDGVVVSISFLIISYFL